MEVRGGAGARQMIAIRLALAFAIAVIVPLGLGLFPRHPIAGRRALVLVAPVMVAALIGLMMPRGAAAAALSAPWLLGSAVLGLVVLGEAWRRERGFAGVLRVIAVAYLTFGAGWMVLSRAGIRPLDFPDSTVELTAVHFHYAGFGAVVIASAALSRAATFRKTLQTAAALIAIASPVIAIGITLSLPLAAAGAALLTVGTFVLAVATLRYSKREAASTRKLLLGISSGSVFVSMPLAMLYALSPVTDVPALSIPAMAATHGVLNALGFTLCGLLGWRGDRSAAGATMQG